MAETSKFWNGTTVGDAVLAPYEADTVFADVMRALSRQVNAPNAGCVFNDYQNGQALAAHNAASPVSVDPGYAMVWGTWYHSDAAITFAVPTPGAATRIDRLVLRKDWPGQTIRIILLTGVEGGVEPALTQSPGAVWDMPLWKVSVTTGGVITLTDERQVTSANNQSVFYPWTDPVNPPPFLHPGAIAYVDGVSQTKTLPSPVPTNATAVAVSVTINGTITSPGIVQMYAMSTGYSIPLLAIPPGIYTGQNIGHMVIPMFSATPLQFKVVEVGHGDTFTLSFDVIGWYSPFI